MVRFRRTWVGGIRRARGKPTTPTGMNPEDRGNRLAGRCPARQRPSKPEIPDRRARMANRSATMRGQPGDLPDVGGCDPVGRGLAKTIVAGDGPVARIPARGRQGPKDIQTGRSAAGGAELVRGRAGPKDHRDFIAEIDGHGAVSAKGLQEQAAAIAIEPTGRFDGKGRIHGAQGETPFPPVQEGDFRVRKGRTTSWDGQNPAPHDNPVDHGGRGAGRLHGRRRSRTFLPAAGALKIKRQAISR